ncbi:hypothetical protein SERLA73DRAFT_74192 [Serpula lacrymans var. lacrymans S7.3]|uniref:Uncharacterized protein n=1 Tax=Serpula lacrymans var. lacrymans (strain S7.3) TaxID=936435 RepID=F8Q0V8_SERL3|nr:hypothetical protein SERLA73DRAFT_74192 [Serpula lacrymans var. lacrymans S7.3]
MEFCDVRHYRFFFFGFTTEAKKSYRAVAGFLTSCFSIFAVFKGRRMRQQRFLDRRISVHTPKISKRHPHTVSTFDSLQSTSRHSCSPELSDPQMGSNLGLRTDTTDSPEDDGGAQYAHFEMSVLEHPEPVMDIVSVLRRHPSDTNPV